VWTTDTSTQDSSTQTAPSQNAPTQGVPSEEGVWTPTPPSQDTSQNPPPQKAPAQGVPSEEGVWTPVPSSKPPSSKDASSQNAGSQKAPAPSIAPQNEDALAKPGPDNPHPASLVPKIFLKNFALDQKDIWTAPFKARIQDLNWLAPFAGLTAGLINADAELSSRISTTGTLAKNSGNIANAGLAAMLVGTGSFYLLGKWNGDDHQRETGILAGEAVLNSFVLDEVLKASSQRERPTEGTGQGRFWNGTIGNSSFASNHSIMAWSAATVLAHEYPGPLTKFLAYGLATGISVARVTGRQHFPSDVVVGSALGYLIGRQVYARHHDPDLWGADYGTFLRSPEPREGTTSQNISSPYVPLDSWVYPAFDRLNSLGVIPSSLMGLRPWTRMECARLLEEASIYIDENSPDEATRLNAALVREFAPESSGQHNRYLQLDSLYARVTQISGQPLTDGYHFANTIVNDYGRPYESGTNFITGFSSSASAGPFGFYVRGEWEHAPSVPGLPPDVQGAIQLADQKFVAAPLLPITNSNIAAFNQFRLLDTYVMLNIKGWQASFGKQSLWLGPTEDPFLESNNAEPMYMFRVDQTMPRKLPSIFGLLGPLRVEFWVGKMTGDHVISTEDPVLGFATSVGRTLSRQPMLNGQKINFKPTVNFEFGFGRTGMWGGPDFPITLGTTRRSLFSTGNASGRLADPGDRRSTFDFSYRLPGLRKWVKLYDDSFVEDEVTPLVYPRRAAHNPGLYFSQLPMLPHMDFRVEASYTNLAGLVEPPGGGFFYWNGRYVDGYTNQGQIIGNGTVGRQGIAFRGDSTYWVASDKTLTFGYRTMVQDPDFLKGGSFRDVYLKSEWSLTPQVSLSSFLQYEWWNFPLLTNNTRKTDFTTSFQLTYWPKWNLKSLKK
jgi:membrane-associated phospholipid phosphatase